jgi:hypothetical protein
MHNPSRNTALLSNQEVLAMQEFAIYAWTQILTFLERDAVFYAILGAIGWEILRWLLWRRPKSELTETQLLNRVLFLLVPVIVAAWAALTYRFYWQNMPAEWHGFAIWFVHFVFTVMAAGAIFMLLTGVEESKGSPPKT